MRVGNAACEGLPKCARQLPGFPFAKVPFGCTRLKHDQVTGQSTLLPPTVGQCELCIVLRVPQTSRVRGVGLPLFAGVPTHRWLLCCCMRSPGSRFKCAARRRTRRLSRRLRSRRGEACALRVPKISPKHHPSKSKLT